MICPFVGRAPQCMLVYYLLSQECEIDENMTGEKITYEKIRK